MRTCFVCLLCALYLPASPALSQDVLTVPLVDKGEAGSPFAVSGNAFLREVVRGNELEWAWGEKVVLKNASDKPILLFVVTLTELGRHNAGQRAGPGNGATYQLGDDRFFNEKLIQTGESLVLRDTTPSRPQVECCINPLAEAREASVDYRLLFVQFADGSTFGDPAEARNALTLRQSIVNNLRELLQSHAALGDSGFAAKLQEHSDISGTVPGRQILLKYADGGVRGALGETERILAIAERHATMIAGHTTTPEASPPSR
jgi:hypothetical protein